jgi:hypothetical protein
MPEFKKKDYLIAIGVFFLCFLICLPTINYPIVGDVNFHAQGASNLYHKHVYGGYWRSQEVYYETDVLPLFPLASALLLSIYDSPVHAVRIVAIAFFALSIMLVYLISRRIGLEMKYSLLAAALLAFNPFFFWFCIVIGGTESISVFFFLLFLFLFLSRRETILYYSLMGLAIGLYTMTRTTAAFIIAPFVIYIAYEFFAKKENRIGKLFLFFFSGIFLLLWFLRAYLLTGSSPSQSYIYEFLSDPNKIISFFAMIFKMVFGALPLFMLLLLPFFIYFIYVLIKDKKTEHRKVWILCLFSLAFWIIALSLIYPQSIIVRSRQLIPFVPIFVIFSILGFRSIMQDRLVRHVSKKSQMFSRTKVLNAVMAVILIAGTILTLWLNFGFLKDLSDRIIPLSSTLPQRDIHRMQATSWINKEADSQNGIILISSLNQDDVVVGINMHFKNYLSPSINYLPINDNDNFQIQNRLRDYAKNGNIFVSNEIYVLSDYDSAETRTRLIRELKGTDADISGYSLKELFRSDYPPYSYIFMLRKI